MRSIQLDKQQIKAFCESKHITYLGVFGSALTSHFTSESDVDILVKFEHQNLPTLFEMADMEMELTKLVGRQVDLKTPNDLSPYFRDEVLNHARVYYPS